MITAKEATEIVLRYGMDNLHAAIGVPRDATPTMIKKRTRRLSLRSFLPGASKYCTVSRVARPCAACVPACAAAIARNDSKELVPSADKIKDINTTPAIDVAAAQAHWRPSERVGAVFEHGAWIW